MAEARFASVLRLLLQEYDIYDADTLAANVGGVQGDALADWLRSDAVGAKLASLTSPAHADPPPPLPAPTAPPPPPPTVTVVLQVAVPRVPTTETGTLTENCRTRNAQAQTARRSFYGVDVETQSTEPAPSLVEACGAEREAAEQRALNEQNLRRAAEQQAAAATTAWMDAERARAAAETARAAAEDALADALAAHGDLTGRVEMVAASTNTNYMVDGLGSWALGLASTGTQTTVTVHVLSPDRHSPAAPLPPMPRSSSPPPHRLPPPARRRR